MQSIKVSILLLVAALLPRLASADLVGSYTADANTTLLLQFDEAAGTTNITSQGTFVRTFHSVSNVTTSGSAVVTNLLGYGGYSTNSPAVISFGGCMSNSVLPAPNYIGFGCDYNNDGIYSNSVSDHVPVSALGLGQGGTNTPWTIEALVSPGASPITNQYSNILTCDSPLNTAGRRALIFRMNASAGTYILNFVSVGGSLSANGTIPATGPHALVSNAWYHTAVTYSGSNVTIYWTRLDPSIGAANVLSVTPQAATNGWATNSSPLTIGTTGRPGAGIGHWPGLIDEVRFSKVCRAANQMQFFSQAVTITQNPAALQNVDYNQPVSFTVGAASLTPISYQWRFNSNAIAGATGTTYTITNVAAFNAGYFDCVATNTAGYAATSSVARLVVGAENFMAHRYSFTSDSTDSIGGAHGTNSGNATISGGQLVLDGSSGTYMQLPGNLFNSGVASALTVEFWATFGTNPNNTWAWVFNASYNGGSPVSFYGFLCNNGSGLPESRGGKGLAVDQSLVAPNSLNGLTRHITCTIDPPNNTLAIYTNGVLAAITNVAPVTIADVNNALSYVGWLGGTATTYMNASIDELRIYNGALSPITVKQSYDQGPNVVLTGGPAEFVVQPVNTSVPLGQTATFTATAVGYLPISYQWFTNGAPFPGATNANFSFVPALSDNGASVFCRATNIIGVTTYVTNSATATLSVFVPPTLAWLDAANGGADSFWNTTSLNWTNNAGSIVAFAQTNGVLFDARGSGSPNVDLAEAITLYNLTANASTDYTLVSSGVNGSLNGAGGITKQNTGRLTIGVPNNLSGPVLISGGTLQVGNADANGSLGTSVVTNNAALSVNRSDTALNLPNAIHGTGTVTFDGAGTVTVSGNSSYTGGTLINSGIVNLPGANGLGSASSGTTVANGAQLNVTGNVIISEGLTLTGAGDGNGALRKSGAGAATVDAPVLLAADSTIGAATGSTLILSNVVSGTAALTAVGSGTLTLATNNTFNGGFTLNGPFVNVGHSGALGSGPVTVSGNGRLVLATGLTFTNAVTANVIAPGAGGGLLTVADNTNGTVTTITGPVTFNFSPVSGGNFGGPVSSGYLLVAGPVTNTVTGFISSRLGNVRFAGGGNYTQLNLNQGTLSLGAHNGLSTSASIAVAGSGAATFDLNGFNQSLTGLTDGGANPKFVTNSSASLSTLTMNLAAANTFSGVISGNLALVVNGGSSTLTLNGTNAYTGNTTVNSGTLQLAQAGLAAASTVTVTNGATLQLDFPGTNQIAALVLNGASQVPGVYNNTTSPTFITGFGSLLVGPSVNTNSTNIVASVSGSNLALSWPASHIGWRLLVQTNSLAQGLNPNTNAWTAVPGSATTNQVNITIDPANPTVFYRLVYP